MYIPYNSRKDYHKSKFGAVEEGTPVVFRIVMPRNFSVSAAYLVIREEFSREKQQLSMQWDCMQGDSEEWWKIEFTPESEGLYFYHFEYDTPFGRSVILLEKNGFGTLNSSGKDWQMTVYEKGFTAPDKFKGGIIYQIFPDRFAFSGKVKKNVPSNRVLRCDRENEPYWKPNEKGITLNNDFFGGDLEGIRKKLPYLKSLNVTCIYLNPIFRANSNHRYDTGDYLSVDPLLGDEKDFKNLCRDAKKEGISIILDGVFSHTGDDSVYFNKYSNYSSLGAYQSKNSPYYNWYKFRSFPDDYECWWGIKILPEVTEENEDFLRFITGENGVLRKWMRLGADGWRLDVADELPDVFLDRLRCAVKEEKEDALILGEVWEDASNKVSYSVRRRYLLGKQLDSVMNYPFAEAIIRFVRTGDTSSFGESIMTVLENYPKTVVDVLMNHIGSHDTMRIINALAGESLANKSRDWQSGRKLSKEDYAKGIRLVKLASVIQFTLPGIPSIYYGDEIGMQGYADPFNRACFIEENAEESLLEHYRKLGKIRTENSCFKEGSFKILSCERACIAYVRQDESSAVLVIVNRNETEIDYYLNEEWHFGEVIFGAEECSRFVKIPALSSVMIKIRK